MEYSEWPNPKKVASKFIPPKPENESHSNSASNQIRTPAASNFIGSEQKIQLDPNAKVEITNIAKPFLAPEDEGVDITFNTFCDTSAQSTQSQPTSPNSIQQSPSPSNNSGLFPDSISISHTATNDCIATQDFPKSMAAKDPPSQSANTVRTEPLPQNRQESAMPANSTTPVAPDLQAKQLTYYRKQNAFTQIYDTVHGLFTYDKSGNGIPISFYHFKSCHLIELDANFKQASYYIISFVEKSDPLIIIKKDFLRPGKLFQALSLHFPNFFVNYPFPRKINTALQHFFINHTHTHPVNFYSGWKNTNGSWEYTLFDEKTHESYDFSKEKYDPFKVDSNHSVRKDFSLSVQLTAARQTAEMMHSIADRSTRNLIFDILHIASLFSLLSSIEGSFPFGFCLYCYDSLTLGILEPLFSWFSDTIINLSENKPRFLMSLTERKDQPLLVRDTAAQIANANILENAIRTGIITNGNSQNKLYALPVILSNISSHISQSSKFIRFDFQSQQFEKNAMQVIREKHSYFMSYLYYFNIFVQNHIAEFQAGLTTHTEEMLNKYAGHSLSRDCVTAFGIFCAVEEIIKCYHASLYPDTNTEQLIQNLFFEQTEDTIVDTFSYISCQDSDKTIATVFFNTANNMIQSGDFDIREFGNDNTFAPCPEAKQGIIYIYKNDPCLTNEAYAAVINRTGYTTGIVKKALVRTGAFNGAFTNNDGYQYRISGKNPITNKEYTPVYRFTTKSIIIPHRPHSVTANGCPENSDFSLELGRTISGDPIIWYGTMSSHICITGKTGSGKSYFLKKQIMQLPAQNARCIIFDTKGTFTSTDPQKSPPEWPPSNIDIINMSNSKAQHIFFQPLFPNESNKTIISRFIEIVKKTTILGANQKNELVNILEDGLTNLEISNFTDLIDAINSKTKTAKKESPLIPKINEMNRILPYGEEPFDLQLDKPGITILDFYNGFDKSAVSTVADLILSVISNSRLAAASNSNTPIILVLDECQIFDWRSSSPAHIILTQGREKGLSIWFCTQYPEQVNDPKVLGQADFRVHFRPGENDISKIAKMICRSTYVKTQDCEKQLIRLEQGQFICTINNELYISEVPQRTI